MAKFVAISGPSSTGKTSLVDSISTYPEMSKAIFSPDIYSAVWQDLVDKKFFSEWKEINTDPEYLCLYIMRVIDYYEHYIKDHESSDKLIIMDGCWIDLSIYAIINLWYNRGIKEVQESILHKLNRFSEKISRVYFTTFDSSKHVRQSNRIGYKMANLKLNIPLEIQFYELFSNFNNVVKLPSTDISDSSIFIIDDLKNLGYL